MASLRIVAEYAKSNRSSCKKCAKPIIVGALRLGLVSRDSRGFDMTKWHHLNCFKMASSLDSIPSVDEIGGFTNLAGSDQEAVKKLMGSCSQSQEEILDDTKQELEESTERSCKRLRVDGNEAEDGKQEQGENDIMNVKLSTPNKVAALEIAFSLFDVKNKYKDAALLTKWKSFQTVIFLEREEGLHDSSKIAAFDFDGCLVKTSVKKVGADAWFLMYPSIPEKLQSLYNDGYKLVIFTNESNIDRWKNKRQVAVDSKIGRLNNFIKLVKVPIQVFIACGIGKSDGQAEDPFRKPKTGMWQLMEQHLNSGIPIDMDQSFYVGDAAGRLQDHSDADIKFAQAIGLKFYVPEEYFL